jgi:hypothetical protein
MGIGALPEPRAQEVALEHCAAVMGPGCEVMWQANGYIAVARNPVGDVILAADAKKSDTRKRLMESESCRAWALGCIPIGIFKSTDTYESDGRTLNIRRPKNPQTLRKLYAAAAWVRGERKSWVASGHRTSQEAKDAAMAGCSAGGTSGRTCEVAYVTGNGVLILFNYPEGISYFGEYNAERAAEAVGKYCAGKSLACTVVRVFDARQPGLIEQPSP